MTNETVTKSGRFYCVSLTPDICKTPVGASTPPLPYTVVGEFSEATNASPNVKSHSEPVILHQRSTIPTVKGDAPGRAGGVKSGTVGKQVDTKTSSTTHHANGANLVQVGREVWMNARNTVGKIYERDGETARPLLATLSAVVDKKVADMRDSLKPAAQAYQDDISAPMHATGERLMDAGGKTVLAGAAVAGTGVVLTATGVGAAAGAPMAAAGAAVVTVGTTAAAGGAVMSTSATVLDQAAAFVLTGQTPDLVDAATTVVTGAVEGLVMNKLGPLGRWLGTKVKALGGKLLKKALPAKKPSGPPSPPPKPPASHDDDGKSRGKKAPKSEPPSDCCPKDKAPAGKPVKSKKPIHFGTGQEILEQTDFAIAGAIPIDWTRTYRSGAETEDWGLLGARWSSAFTTSVSLTAQGCVYHDESGRALCLPHLAPGQSHDNRKEGFILARRDADSFTLTWRDGSTDTFARGTDGYLPHGYAGVNPMREADAPLRAERFVLVRSAARDGRGLTIEQWPQALPGALLLRVRCDDKGAVVEAMREELPVAKTDIDRARAERANVSDPHGHPRIGRVEQVLDDGTRIRHVRYRYAPDPSAPPVPQSPTGEAPATPFPGPSYNLIAQTNQLGDARTYTYQHHLLSACTSYTGFTQTVEWVSLAALRARWAGSAQDDAALAEAFPITPTTSYQARATASRAADGSEGSGVTLAYRDIDTTRVSDNGDVLDYTFDHNWLVTCVARVTNGVATSLGTREWDSDGMLLADSDSIGHTTRYAYDAAGNLTSSTDAAGHTTHITYDGANKPVAITDALGHTTLRGYDADGRLASVTDALGHVSGYRYDDKGRLIEQIDAKGGSKRFAYDRAGRLITYTDCSDNATRYAYDAQGRLAEVIAATAGQGEITRYAYDALGRLITLTHPDKTTEHYAYDADGNVLVNTDALGRQTHYRYNGQGMPVARTDAIGQTVRYRYDTALRLVELANAKDERYLLAYDADGALTSETGFDGKTTTYTYDQAGQLTASECAGQRNELVRDVRGLLLAKMNADGMVRYAYDALGRMTAVAAPQAEQRFAYDALGQLVEERAAYFLVAPPVVVPVDGSRAADAAFVMTHAYDELGNRTRTTLPNGRRIDTLRFGSGHWHGTQWQGASIVDIESDAQYRERTRRLGRSIDAERLAATRDYDPQSRLTNMTLTRPADGPNARPLRERRFRYDAVGNLLSIEHGRHALGTFRYSYDPVGQLLSASQPELDEIFFFDPAGNLLDPGLAQRTANATPASKDPSRLPPITANLLRSFLGHSYTYDAQGNVTAKHTAPDATESGATSLLLEYDADNRLRRSVRTGTLRRSSASYFYDAYSRRVAKRVVEEWWQHGQQIERDAPDRVSEATTLFVWDGDVLAQELTPKATVTYLYEPDSFVPMARVESRGGYGSLAGAGGTGAAVALPVHLGYVKQWLVPGPTHADKRAALEQADGPAEEAHQAACLLRQTDADDVAPLDRIDFYNCDHLGTPRELVDEKGRVVWAARFKAWGRALKGSHYGAPDSVVNEIAQPLRFQGQYEDGETGLFYNRYRYYDPDSGRYVTRDPIGLSGGLNEYTYAPNPTGGVDQSTELSSAASQHGFWLMNLCDFGRGTRGFDLMMPGRCE
ncbi:PAAR-like domain-containing protein [Massilia sp. DWR3-1-1]|uniref:PAAR-like domain-containing protein n=1 Tax=Massilia sp. DWR3-1-1 TaxID=2804559 RepID=UPI003CFB5475